jgi:hypothetical protein
MNIIVVILPTEILLICVFGMVLAIGHKQISLHLKKNDCGMDDIAVI